MSEMDPHQWKDAYSNSNNSDMIHVISKPTSRLLASEPELSTLSKRANVSFLAVRTKNLCLKKQIYVSNTATARECKFKITTIV